MKHEEATELQRKIQDAGHAAGLVRYEDDSFGLRVWPDGTDPTGPPAQEVRAVGDYSPTKARKPTDDKD